MFQNEQEKEEHPKRKKKKKKKKKKKEKKSRIQFSGPMNYYRNVSLGLKEEGRR